MEIPENIKISMKTQAYFNLALQYYLLARQGIFCHSVPVAGNLAHHAIEMLLHAGLSKIYTYRELKDKYKSHNLVPMWNKFKQLFPNVNLGKYNMVVTRYNKWEEIRYPAERKTNTIMFFDIRKGKESKMTYPKYKKDDEYRINLEELDEFFKSISLLFISSEYVKTALHGERLKIYKKENYHIIWGD